MTELQFQPPTSSELSAYSKAFQGLGAKMNQQPDPSHPSTATGMEMEPTAGSKRKEVAQESTPVPPTEAASKLQKKGPGRGKGKAKTTPGNVPILAVPTHQLGAQHSEALDPTRGRVGGAKTQPSLRDVFADQVGRGAPVTGVTSVCSLAALRVPERIGTGQIPKKGDFDLPRASRTPISSGHPVAERGRGGRGSASTTDGSGSGQRSVLALLTMEPRQQTRTSQHGSGANEAGMVAKEDPERHRERRFFAVNPAGS